MKKLFSSVLAACMIASQPVMTHIYAENEESTAQDTEKNETVYIITDASGNTNDVIVSEWLKNTAKAKEIHDVSTLTDIENVNGDETFTAGSDHTLTWQADGNDIYYQGKSDQEVPVSMKVTYTLDGKTITPEELKGKSGHVTICFDYENKAETTVTIQGREQKVKVGPNL